MSDPHEQLQKVQRVRELLRSTRVVLGLIVLLGLSSLAMASGGPLAGLYGRIFLWFFGQVAAIAAAVALLRALRRRRFGSTSSTRMRAPSDALLAIAAMVGGVIALVGFVPVVGAGRGIDVAIVAIGTLLAAGGLRAAGLYLLRP